MESPKVKKVSPPESETLRAVTPGSSAPCPFHSFRFIASKLFIWFCMHQVLLSPFCCDLLPAHDFLDVCGWTLMLISVFQFFNLIFFFTACFFSLPDHASGRFICLELNRQPSVPWIFSRPGKGEQSAVTLLRLPNKITGPSLLKDSWACPRAKTGRHRAHFSDTPRLENILWG